MQCIYNFFSNCPAPIQAVAFTTPIVSLALTMLHISLDDEYKNKNSAQALEFYENAPKFLKTSEMCLSTQMISCIALAVLLSQPEIFIPLALFAGLCLLCVKMTDLDDLKNKAIILKANEILKDNDQRLQEWMQRTRKQLVEECKKKR